MFRLSQRHQTTQTIPRRRLRRFFVFCYHGRIIFWGIESGKSLSRQGGDDRRSRILQAGPCWSSRVESSQFPGTTTAGANCRPTYHPILMYFTLFHNQKKGMTRRETMCIQQHNWLHSFCSDSTEEVRRQRRFFDVFVSFLDGGRIYIITRTHSALSLLVCFGDSHRRTNHVWSVGREKTFGRDVTTGTTVKRREKCFLLINFPKRQKVKLFLFGVCCYFFVLCYFPVFVTYSCLLLFTKSYFVTFCHNV
jgi:hypothetical protein